MKNIFTQKKIAALLVGFISLFPIISFAAGKTLSDIVILIIAYLNQALFLIIGLAIVTFVWNVFRYFFTEKDKAEAGMYVLYSIIGFFIILSFWGIVAVVKNTFKLQDQRPDTVPSSFNFNANRSSSVSNTSTFSN